MIKVSVHDGSVHMHGNIVKTPSIKQSSKCFLIADWSRVAIDILHEQD